MASEAIIQELFQVAKASSSFKGMSDEEVMKACQAYKDRSDEDIQAAMDNIQKKDEDVADEADNKAVGQQKIIEENKKKMIVMHHQEEVDHQKDERDAEKVLEELFNS